MAGGFTAGVVLAICWAGLVPVQFATTIPVTTAVTITRAIPIAISFQGLFQLLSISTLLAEKLRDRGALCPLVLSPVMWKRAMAHSSGWCS